MSQLFASNVCVIEYPRSGANWLLKMLSSYLRVPYRDLDKNPESITGSLLKKLVNIPPLARFNTIKCLNPLKHLEKTHVFHNILSSTNKKIIYVIRDPRDVMVSYYHHEKHFARTVLKRQTEFRFDDELSVNDELSAYIKYRFETKSFPYLNWSEHVKKALNDPRILFIKYEELLTDPSAQMAKAIDFLKLKINQKRIASIVSHHAFEKEKRRLKEDRQEYSIHLRKGVSGEWKEIFNKEMLEYIYAHGGEQMRIFEYETI